ncbi:MAG: peptidoglycan DD-metalloendopeptidase family protein [Epsilonproteobacteria bacterium]|nr:peptidoglycan DD-metalloendopeptidase family protein [Campylobacterota bacterium]
MHRLLLLFLFFCIAVYAQNDIDKKIKKTSSKLHSYSRNYSNLNKKMDKTAKAILRQKRELMQQDAYLKKLKAELESKESNYKRNTKELELLKATQLKLKKRQNKLEEELVFVIAKSVSLSVVLDQEYPANEEALIELEVLKSMLAKSKAKAQELSQLFFQNAKVIDTLHQKTSSLEKSIASIDAKRKELLEKQAANKKALKKLQRVKASYKKELKKLLKRQNTLKKTLSKLNLIKIDAIKKAKEEKARKKAFKRQKIILNENLPKVKKHGSSYQSVRTIRYRGPKTIAPLYSYTITKKYGTYRDPIYGIKIFNESISLKPKQPNAKVRTVFNGKVIYADNTAVLDNIVIVEHKNGLHTIYANLSQIAPGIRKGKRVKRGAVIGRVKDELVFEVTQKSAHINPIRLFR